MLFTSYSIQIPRNKLMYIYRERILLLYIQRERILLLQRGKIQLCLNRWKLVISRCHYLMSSFFPPIITPKVDQRKIKMCKSCLYFHSLLNLLNCLCIIIIFPLLNICFIFHIINHKHMLMSDHPEKLYTIGKQAKNRKKEK